MNKAFETFALVCGVAILALDTAHAQTFTEWDDVSVTHLNRERAHTVGIPLADPDAVDAGEMDSSPYFMSLNGVWRFKWAPDPDMAPDGFEVPGYSDSAWDNIDVPSAWQVYGVRNAKNWDKPLYCNVAYPFSYDAKTYSVMASRPGWFTYNDNMKNPVGSYRRTFTVPADWQGRDIYLRFNGAGHGYYVWVNGNLAGYAEDSYLPSEFNVTDLVKDGENTLAVQVYRFTSGSFLECQDYWRLTGITRDVFLWSAPKTQIRDYFVTTSLTDNYTNATVNIDADIAGLPIAGKLTAKVTDGSSVLAQKCIDIKDAGHYVLSFDVAAPKLWSAEEPNLYNLSLTLNDGASDIDIRAQKVGFRQVEIGSKGEILINGQPLLIHGVNRHDFSTIHGRAVTREEMEMDVLTMKKLNINAVRTSHYPNNPYFYELCSKYGLYVLAEADVECHANTGLSSVAAFKDAMVERNENHVLWLRNNPCILIWSFGNESGNGGNFAAVSKAVKALDTTRLTHYEGNSDYADVSSTMYAGSDWIESIGRDRLNQANSGQRAKPHIQCENTHAMGNSMGNQREYYDLYERYPALAGEFIWDWKDQGLTMPVPGDPSQTYWAYGGDFGDNPNDGNFCINGVIFPDYTYSAKALNVKKIYQPADFVMRDSVAGEFVIKNKMAFSNLNIYDYSYQVLEDGIVVSESRIDGIDVAGGKSMTLSLPGLLPSDADDAAEYSVRFSVRLPAATPWADAGYEVAAEQFCLRAPLSRPAYAAHAGAKLDVTEEKNNFVVTGPDFSATFSKGNGQLSKYVYKGKSLLRTVIKPNAFRAPTDNDGRQVASWTSMGLRTLSVAAGDWSVKANDDGSVTLTADNTYTAKAPTAFRTQMSYTVMPDGVITVSSLITPSQKGVILPKLGFMFEMAKDYEDFVWYGRGPWDNYRDRKESCFPGLYHSTVTDQWTSYVMPQDCGNKEDVRFIALTDADGAGLMVVAPDKMSATVGHWRPSTLYSDNGRVAKHPHEVNFTTSTVVCVDAAVRALGNASCGPDVLSKYELRAEVTPFNFILMPLDHRLTDSEMTAKARVGSAQCQPVVIKSDRGAVSLTTSTAGATIYYSTDMGETYLQYKAPFKYSGGIVMAYAACPGMIDSMVSDADISMFVDKSRWSVYSVDSNQGGGEDVKNAIDNNPSTIWHTNYGSAQTSCPHEIVIDMKDTYLVTAFVYQARGDMSNGRVKEYEVYFSNNPLVWGAPAAAGSFKDMAGEQVVQLPEPVTARYFRLIARSEVNGNAWTSAAELGIEASGIADAVSDGATAPEARTDYYVKDRASGLFLHSDVNGTDGKWSLGVLDFANPSYRFNIARVDGFTSYYRIKTADGFMSQGDTNWALGLGSTANTTSGWIQLEAADHAFGWRAVWKGSADYLNFDSHNLGSYIYCDKKSAAALQILTQDEAGIPAVVYDDSVAQVWSEDGAVHVSVCGNATLTVTAVDGVEIASVPVVDHAVVKMPVPGVYTAAITRAMGAVYVTKLVVR